MSRTALTTRPRRRTRRRSSWIQAALIALLSCALIFAAVYYIGLFPRQIEKVVYPLYYEDLIERYAGEYELDPARVAAVIYCESSFRSDAVSSAGAIGLMQIMPETGEWLATKFDDLTDYNVEMLYDPVINIRMGCWYLRYLDGRYGGDLTKATAAYHAGGGKVDEWLEDPSYSKDGQSLDDIPSRVTGAYVRNVASVYEKYKEILNV